ncbi:MAG: hypothetical protein R3F11_01705 [Verrucomicrobiales bacterium]
MPFSSLAVDHAPAADDRRGEPIDRRDFPNDARIVRQRLWRGRAFRQVSVLRRSTLVRPVGGTGGRGGRGGRGEAEEGEGEGG